MAAYVDYDRVARTYETGRAPLAQPDAWGAAVAPYLPTERRAVRVLDLGAGTGIFTRAWPEWGATQVVGMDPSRSMLREACRVGLPAEAGVVAGRAEHLPLRTGAVDAAWLSAVFHHFSDPHQSIAELHRVLADGGVVFIRALFPDLGRIGWFDYFPGVERGLARFPTLADLTRAFEAGGFVPAGVEEIVEPAVTAATAAEWVRRMRHADTFLGALTDDEIRHGLGALAGLGSAEIGGSTLHIAVYAR